MKQILFALPMATLALMAARPAAALSLQNLKPLAYDCRIAMSADDAPFFERTFVAQAESGSHGGGATAYDAGAGYKLDVIADAKWLGVTWSKGETTIAKGVFVFNEGQAIHRVAILYNPRSDQEQVALNCSRQDPEQTPAK